MELTEKDEIKAALSFCHATLALPPANRALNWTERLVTDIRSTYLSRDYTSVHTENWASVYCQCCVATLTIKILVLERYSQCASWRFCLKNVGGWHHFGCVPVLHANLNPVRCLNFLMTHHTHHTHHPGHSTGAGARWVRSCSRAVLFWLKATWLLTPKMRKKYWVSWVFSVA